LRDRKEVFEGWFSEGLQGHEIKVKEWAFEGYLKGGARLSIDQGGFLKICIF